MKDLTTIAEEINAAAALHPRMQNFQAIRRRLHGLSRVKTRRIFSEQTIKKHYAFHSGGRAELQYNIAFEEDGEWFRYGVAFSLEPSQSLPRPLVLKPKIDRFNAYVRKNATALEDLRFWFWDPRRNPQRSAILPITRSSGPLNQLLVKFSFRGRIRGRIYIFDILNCRRNRR